MKKITFILVFSLSCFLYSSLPLVSLAQVSFEYTPLKGNIKGIVKDKAGLPVEGIVVLLEGTSKSSITDKDGVFEIAQVKAGNYNLIIKPLGIEPVIQFILIKPNETTEVEFVLPKNLQELPTITILTPALREVEHLPDYQETYIYAGKKTEVLNVKDMNANLISNNSRQIFSKIPGVMIWENDGSGVQVGIATRGLSPNRSWEFNVRQNGYDVSSDPMGYPEAYYNPQMEMVSKIEFVRGASSLQYGSQFGGLLNYVLKKGDANRPFVFETQNSTGSYGMFATYNAIGGTVGKLNYYVAHNYRKGDGYRENSRFDIQNFVAHLNYQLTNRLKLGFELTSLYYLNQQPGGLTDAAFLQNTRQSLRSRNWFSTPWVMPALTLDYQISNKTQLSFKSFGLVGERNSIGFVSAITNADVIGVNGYANRQIDRDLYRNFGTETRLLTHYRLAKQEHTIAAGVRYFYGSTYRKQRGLGDNGTGYNLNLQTANFPNELAFYNNNLAFFVENIFRITSKFTITPGVRYEYIDSKAGGRINYNSDGSENRMINQNAIRQFVLLGVGAGYKVTKTTNIYANISQAYRPILFSEITQSATTDVIDANLQDAFGHNADLGYRGYWKNFLTFDVSLFYLLYNNRIGNISVLNEQNVPVNFRTNIGTSISQGAEMYAELDVLSLAGYKNSPYGSLSFFGSLSLLDAKYQNLRATTIASGNITERNLQNNRVEYAPNSIRRVGLNYAKGGFALTWQYSHTEEVFADASNTQTPNSTATAGKIPAYSVQDISATYKFLGIYNFKAGINNLNDNRYFTRRSGGYPGPGVLPADGRTWYLSIGAKF